MSTALAGSAASLAAERLFEHVAKDVAEITKTALKTAAALATRAVDARVPVLIIDAALLRVTQHAVGFVQFLELFLRVFVPRIFIGMDLDRLGPISGFNLVAA